MHFRYFNAHRASFEISFYGGWSGDHSLSQSLHLLKVVLIGGFHPTLLCSHIAGHGALDISETVHKRY